MLSVFDILWYNDLDFYCIDRLFHIPRRKRTVILATAVVSGRIASGGSGADQQKTNTRKGDVSMRLLYCYILFLDDQGEI